MLKLALFRWFRLKKNVYHEDAREHICISSLVPANMKRFKSSLVAPGIVSFCNRSCVKSYFLIFSSFLICDKLILDHGFRIFVRCTLCFGFSRHSLPPSPSPPPCATFVIVLKNKFRSSVHLLKLKDWSLVWGASTSENGRSTRKYFGLKCNNVLGCFTMGNVYFES